MPKGNPGVPRKPLQERFLEKVKEVESGCKEWQSTIHRGGYGKFWIDGKQVPAHRVAYMLGKGEIPKGLWVLHHCDNRKCVNPDHLYLGTALQNADDRMKRNRSNPFFKLTASQAEEATRLYRSNNLTQQHIAERFGVDQTTISRIVLGKNKLQRIGGGL